MIWVTIGYVVLFGVFAAAFMESFLNEATLISIVLIMLAAVALYLILAVSYGLLLPGFTRRSISGQRGE